MKEGKEKQIKEFFLNNEFNHLKDRQKHEIIDEIREIFPILQKQFIISQIAHLQNKKKYERIESDKFSPY